MAKKKKKTQLSSEGKTELAKAIAEKSDVCQNLCKCGNQGRQVLSLDQRMAG